MKRLGEVLGAQSALQMHGSKGSLEKGTLNHAACFLIFNNKWFVLRNPQITIRIIGLQDWRSPHR